MKKFENIPFAEYEEINDSIIDYIAQGLDVLTKNAKGAYLTEALVQLDLARNKEAIRAFYVANKNTIDAYFELIDTQKVVDRLQQTKSGQQIIETGKEKIMQQVPGFLTGLVLGGIAVGIVKR